MNKIMLTIALILAVLVVFLFGLWLASRLDQLRKENRRRLARGRFKKRRPIRVAAESEDLQDVAARALELCRSQYDYMEFRCTQASASQMLQALYTRDIDIAIMTAENAAALDTIYSAAPIADPREAICVVWNNTVPCKDRDRVLTALENEHCRLKKGYCDY